MDVGQIMAQPIAQQLLLDEPVLHLSYTGRDGAPRVIPIAYLWAGGRFAMWTIPTSAKVRALRADPRVAITIDILGPPPRVLLARGQAELATVDGVPDGYLQASHRTMPPEAWEAFDTQVRGVYEQMVAITVTPEWGPSPRLRDHRTPCGRTTHSQPQPTRGEPPGRVAVSGTAFGAVCSSRGRRVRRSAAGAQRPI
jgi:hypothetical protein